MDGLLIIDFVRERVSRSLSMTSVTISESLNEVKVEDTSIPYYQTINKNNKKNIYKTIKK